MANDNFDIDILATAQNRLVRGVIGEFAWLDQRLYGVRVCRGGYRLFYKVICKKRASAIQLLGIKSVMKVGGAVYLTKRGLNQWLDQHEEAFEGGLNAIRD